MTPKIIDNFGVSNQYVIEYDRFLTFQSYDTIIAKYNQETGLLLIDKKWDTSHTTKKYFYKFIEKYVCTINHDNEFISEVLEKTSHKKDYIEQLIEDNVIHFNYWLN